MLISYLIFLRKLFCAAGAVVYVNNITQHRRRFLRFFADDVI